MEFPDKWYIKGSNELEAWAKKELDGYVNVSFYTNQLFYDAKDTFHLWSWLGEEDIEKLKNYTELTFKEFVNCYEYSKNPFPINKSIDGNYLKPLLKKLGIR